MNIIIKTCPICSNQINKKPTIEYLNNEFSYLSDSKDIFNGLSICICDVCSFGFAYPYIKQDKISNFYKEIYRGPNSVYELKSSIYSYDDFTFTPRAISQIMLAKTFREFKDGDSFLNIGAADGMPFHVAKMLCPPMRFFAVEPDNSFHPILEKLKAKIYPVTFGPSPIKSIDKEKFSFILMSHVLEHFSGDDVIPTLKHVFSLLANDGILLCEVPLCDLQKYADKRGNDSPHLSFFSKESLGRALEKAGFKTKFCKCVGPRYEFWWMNCKKQEYMLGSQKKRPKYRLLLERILDIFPNSVQRRVLKYYRKLKMPSLYSFLANEDFQYGKDRYCVRAVASKS